MRLPALADGWSVYGNARFGYLMPLPPGFSAVAEADNGDGGASRSADGKATLAVWGANLLDAPFETEVARRMASDEADGWHLSYRQRGDYFRHGPNAGKHGVVRHLLHQRGATDISPLAGEKAISAS